MPEAEEADTRRARLWETAEERNVPLRAILVTVGVVVVVYLSGRLIYKLREVLLLVVVAGFVALLLNPVVVIVQRRVPRRGYAVGVVTLAALVGFVALAGAFGYPLVGGITNLVHHLPTYVRTAERGRGWIGHLVRRYHVQQWVQKNAPKLTSYAKNLSKPALALGKGAVSLILALFVIFMLVLLLLLEGPRLRRGVLGLMSAERSLRYSRIATEMTRAVTGYMLGNFITSLVAGVVVFVTLLILGVPFPFLWGLWVALLDFLPMVGGALAGIPTVLFAFTHSLTAGFVTLAVFLLYTQIENHVLNPIVMSRTVRINPLLVLIAVLVGANIGAIIGGFFGGFVGALLAIPLAGSLQVLVRELWHSTDGTDVESAARAAVQPYLASGASAPVGRASVAVPDPSAPGNGERTAGIGRAAAPPEGVDAGGDGG